MIVFGACVGDGGRRFARLALPSIQAIAKPEDVILTEDGRHGICSAYNAIIERALTHPDLELLVLMHDDLRLLDPQTRATLLTAARRPRAGVLGVVGGRRLVGIRWWEGAERVGGVYEPRGLLPRGTARWEGQADVVDGMLLALTPAALQRVRFDAVRFPAFHGYDADICAQVAEAGLRVEVVRLDVFHNTKSSFGDLETFTAAHREAAGKWPHRLGPATTTKRPATMARSAAERTRRVLKRRLTSSTASIPLVHADVLDPDGVAIAKTLGSSDRLEVWLSPSNDPHRELGRIIALAQRAGVEVLDARLLSPETPRLSAGSGHARALHLLRGGNWPIHDLVELRVGR